MSNLQIAVWTEAIHKVKYLLLKIIINEKISYSHWSLGNPFPSKDGHSGQLSTTGMSNKKLKLVSKIYVLEEKALILKLLKKKIYLKICIFFQSKVQLKVGSDQ